MKKKLISIFLLATVLLVMVCALASCGDAENENTTPAVTSAVSTTHTHAFGEWETANAATCLADGVKERYCSCGEKQTATITATGHKFGDWETTKEPSLTETGEKERACACGFKETETVSKLPLVTTVTAEEWKNALDFSKFTSITVVGSESGAEDGITFEFDATIKYYGGLVHSSYSGRGYDGEDVYISYAPETLDNFYSLGTLCFRELHYLVSDYEELSDFGYSKLTYSVTEKNYRTIDSSGCIYTFWFENGRLVKYSYEENGQAEYLRGTYIFTDENTTERFNIPLDQIRTEYQDIVNSISSSTKFYYYDKSYNKVYCDSDDIKGLLNGITIEVVERYEKGLLDDKIYNYRLETSTMSSERKPIKLDIREGEIYEIKIGSTYENSTYYYTE